MKLETNHIYTQDEAIALHEIAIRCTMIPNMCLDWIFELAKDAAKVSDAIEATDTPQPQAPATPQAENGGAGARYVVTGRYGILQIWDTEKEQPAYILNHDIQREYDNIDLVNSAAARLNAGSGGE